MLKRILLAAALIASTTATAPPQSSHALVGTYTCRENDSPGPKWHFTSVNTPFGGWVRARASAPAQNGQPAGVSDAFVGYDRNAKRWNIVVVNDDGSYYTRESSSSALDGSQWKDRDPADGGQAEITLPNPNQYVFDFRQTQKDGKIMHQRVVCTKTAT